MNACPDCGGNCRRCATCGDWECVHHTFNPMPRGCKCEPGEWRNRNIPTPCEAFRGKRGQACETCEHDEGCHGAEIEEVKR